MSTYLELVNNVLNRLNEVELDQTTFTSTRGIHQSVKLNVRNAVNQINAQKWEWPYNYAASSQIFTAGTGLYSFPSDYKIADWESFYIEKGTFDSVDYKSVRLVPIQRQEWYKYFRSQDLDAGSDGIRRPEKVFQYNNGQYGVTPFPNNTYTLHYNYWKLTDSLVDYDDVISIPEDFNWVIETGALESMYEFLDNDQRAQLSKLSFKEAIAMMARVLVPQNISDMRDTVVNFGGANYYNRLWPGT